MKTLKFIPCCVAILWGLSAGFAHAGAPRAIWFAAASTVIGETGGSARNVMSDRQDADGLLQRARFAMKEQKFDTAEALIARAEALKVDYGLLHMGDTPKKARRDLETKRRAARRAEPKRASDGQKPLPSNEIMDEASTTPQPERKAYSPFGATPETMADRDAHEALPATKPIGKSDGKSDAPSRSPFDRPAFARAGGFEPPADDSAEVDLPRQVVSGPNKLSINDSPESRRKSDSLMLEARRALAVSDLRRAQLLVDQAKALNVPYGFHDDTPNKIELAIRKHGDVFDPANRRSDSEGVRRQKADVMMEEAGQLLRWHELDEAERLANEASRMNVEFAALDVKPEELLNRITAERRKAGGAANRRPAADASSAPKGPIARTDRHDGFNRDTTGRDAADRHAGRRDSMRLDEMAHDEPRAAATGAAPDRYPNTNAHYHQGRDVTRNQPAQARDPQPNRLADLTPSSQPIERLPFQTEAAPEPVGEGTNAAQLIAEGEQALRNHQKPEALRLFRQAYAQRSQLDPSTARRLQDHLQLLSGPSAAHQEKPETLVDAETAQQKLLSKQLANEVYRQIEASRAMQEKDPRGAVEMLQKTRESVDQSGLDSVARAALLARIDRGINELEHYIDDNRSQIDLDDRNRAITDDVDRRRRHKVEVDGKLAALVEDFNQKIRERRYEEAELVAKKCRELDPENPVVVQLISEASLARSLQNQIDSKNRRDEGFLTELQNVDDSGVPGDSSKPYQFGDAKTWHDITVGRQRMGQQRQRLNEKELEIKRKMSTPVSAKFHEQPLSKVLEDLARMAGVNHHIDPRGLAQEGVLSDTPVTIDLNQDISLQSALRLILQPLNLSFVIKNEVLEITSEQLRNGDVYIVNYNVADLVIPVPNFAPNGEMGIGGALHDAYSHLGVGQPGGFSQPVGALASQNGAGAHGVVDPKVLAQMQRFNPGGGPPAAGVAQPMLNGFGQTAQGGGLQPDFDSLIELITSTVAPQSWDEVGGQGSISSFRPNLSLVVSQTQDVHDQLVDLFDQLRRLQDLQVTIEVRFITLNDNFFERIGVDFQFNIEDHANAINPLADSVVPSATVGLDNNNRTAQGVPAITANQDIQFRQGSFGLGVPTFGGFDAASTALSAGRFGFAILSDIEAYFLVNAAQGDRRSNVLQAPKVTMFNGQQAFVIDATQSPFVISVIPVVGDFAAAQQPVIVILSEGTFLSVQAVVSNDHRFVRLTVAPMFSQITKVDTFTFSGRKSTTKKTSSSESSGNDGDDSSSSSDSDDETTETEGVTVQLPSLAIVSVITTVSVPDGGTVLLGGIKRLSEGRNEFGVPILSKLPYINRLFKNVGIGRDTQSLMMMVTPRIIIQEEEEQALGIQAP